jgi:hypothetical protein
MAGISGFHNADDRCRAEAAIFHFGRGEKQGMTL